ncbi:MAG: imidazoleglycerol-phosphate dehydratase [Candidatus Omnitrophota bacterium]
MKKRIAQVTRKTSETNIVVKLNVDGKGISKVDTGIGFLDHMLILFSFWGFFDLEVIAKGDLKIDIHHTNEDIGIVLGQAFKKALADKKGIKRIGFAQAPMEKVVGNVVLDINGRGFLNLNAYEEIGGSSTAPDKKEGYEFEDAKHFFDGLAKNLGMNLNIRIDYANRDLHATLEPIFKALGIALDQATQIDPRRKGIPSTKGVID